MYTLLPVPSQLNWKGEGRQRPEAYLSGLRVRDLRLLVLRQDLDRFLLRDLDLDLLRDLLVYWEHEVDEDEGEQDLPRLLEWRE